VVTGFPWAIPLGLVVFTAATLALYAWTRKEAAVAEVA
jgi:hypothetical protein